MIILASASPRRKELCELLELEFSVIPAKNEIEIDVNEFYPLPKDKISMISGKSFTGNKIIKKTSFSLTQYHQTFVAKNER